MVEISGFDHWHICTLDVCLLGVSSQSPSGNTSIWISIATGVGAVAGALIAGIVGLLVARLTVRQQREGTDRTIAVQREATQETLRHEQVRLLNERFATAARLLGDEQPAMRLAGVYAMAGLADDWEDQRQTCINVLCAYLRMPYTVEPGEDASEAQRLFWRAGREIRHTVITVIRDHLQPGVSDGASWQGHDFDLSGVVFDGSNLDGARFTGGFISFQSARFIGNAFSFNGARFSGAKVWFTGARFIKGRVSFDDAEFSGGAVSFGSTELSGGNLSFYKSKFVGAKVAFDLADFDKGELSFLDARFVRGEVSFEGAKFSGAEVSFSTARFIGGLVRFGAPQPRTRPTIITELHQGQLSFRWARFIRGEVSFNSVNFQGTEVSFDFAVFRRGLVQFHEASITAGAVSFEGSRFVGSEVRFDTAKLYGGKVDFQFVSSWAAPPTFDVDALASPPAALLLPSVQAFCERDLWLAQMRRDQEELYYESIRPLTE